MPSNTHAASKRPALTASQRDQFLAEGVLHAPGVIPRAVTEAMAGRLWETLARRHRILRDRPQTWSPARPTRLQELKRSGAFDDMACAGLRALLGDFFGEAGWTEPRRWGQALVTFRSGDEPWNVPSAAWHLDLISDEALAPWPRYVRIFALLAPLQPGGGGTVYLAGSHRLVMRLMSEAESPREIRCAALREALKRQNPWIAALCSPGHEDGRIERFMEAGAQARGVRLRVAEITGEPGDVFLMHPATLHAAAANARREPRLMAAETIVARA